MESNKKFEEEFKTTECYSRLQEIKETRSLLQKINSTQEKLLQVLQEDEWALLKQKEQLYLEFVDRQERKKISRTIAWWNKPQVIKMIKAYKFNYYIRMIIFFSKF